MLPRELSSVCQVYAETHRNIFNCSKTVSMTFKAKRAKSSHPITDKWVVKIWNMLTTTNIWELYWILSSQMTKTFRDNCDKNICAANKLRAFISRCSNAVKNVIFRSFCTSGVASPKIGGGKEYDFRLITLFCLEKCLSKHKRTIYLTKIWGDHGPFAPLATPMFCTPMYASQIWWNFRNLCMQRLRVAYNFWMQSSIQPAMESEC